MLPGIDLSHPEVSAIAQKAVDLGCMLVQAHALLCLLHSNGLCSVLRNSSRKLSSCSSNFISNFNYPHKEEGVRSVMWRGLLRLSSNDLVGFSRAFCRQIWTYYNFSIGSWRIEVLDWLPRLECLQESDFAIHGAGNCPLALQFCITFRFIGAIEAHDDCSQVSFIRAYGGYRSNKSCGLWGWNGPGLNVTPAEELKLDAWVWSQQDFQWVAWGEMPGHLSLLSPCCWLPV